MKKTLIAVAALSAMAASAMAANVTVYGVIDTGLHFQNVKDKWTSSELGNKSTPSVNKFDMAAGQNSGCRWGFKGDEELGNSAKIGFILESGFSSDTGKLGQGSRLFGREANLYVTSSFGTLSLARVGALSAGTGSYNLAKYAPFSTGWGSLTGAKSTFWLGNRDRMDNTLTYVTPSFAGIKAYAQYSFDRDGDEAEGNERQNDRYAGFGISFDQGAFSTALVIDSVLYNYSSTNKKDSLGVTWGASYDFGAFKLFGQAQYGKHENTFGFKTSDVLSGVAKYLPDVTGTKVTKDEGIKGVGLTLGVTAPVCGGTLYAQANYIDTKTNSAIDGSGITTDKDKKETTHKATFDKAKAKNWGIAVGYVYPFSKRTSAYTYASYNQLKTTWSYKAHANSPLTNVDNKKKQTEFGVGIVHKF